MYFGYLCTTVVQQYVDVALMNKIWAYLWVAEFIVDVCWVFSQPIYSEYMTL